MTGVIRITLKSDLCAGSGEAAGTTVDRDICIRDSGLPCIPARRLKGCLLDTARWLEKLDQASPSVTEAMFGTNIGTTGAIRVRDALLPGTEAMESWLLERRNPQKGVVQPLQWAAQPLNVENLFTSVRGQTRLEDGVAADSSLRTTRVLTRTNAMDWNRETEVTEIFWLTSMIPVPNGPNCPVITPSPQRTASCWRKRLPTALTYKRNWKNTGRMRCGICSTSPTMTERPGDAG